MLDGVGAGAVAVAKAPQLAELLAEANVPVCLRNAWQSGKQVAPNVDAADDLAVSPAPACGVSLGSCLLQRGLQVVMSHRANVSAVHALVKETCGQVCVQRPVPESLRCLH